MQGKKARIAFLRQQLEDSRGGPLHLPECKYRVGRWQCRRPEGPFWGAAEIPCQTVC